MTIMNCVCCKPVGRALIMMGGPDCIIEIDGKRQCFEMHPMFGPAVQNARGEPADKQPGPRSKFWTAVTLWVEQGSQINAEGVCVWVEPAAPDLVHLGGRNFAVAGSALALKYGVEE